MTYPFVEASVVAKSIADDQEICTMQIKCPRFIWAEVMTHRVFSRNAQSSRAVPVAKMIQEVWDNPVVPIEFGANQPGMQAGQEIDDAAEAMDRWLLSSQSAAGYAEALNDMGVHKQVVNRILEPYVTISAVITSTQWDNFYDLRIHPDAQPEIRALAEAMKEAQEAQEARHTDMHLPYVSDVEQGIYSRDALFKISAARCARVSYKNHDKTDCDPLKDIELANRLLESKHLSPFEHAAENMFDMEDYANFTGGWMSYRTAQGY